MRIVLRGKDKDIYLNDREACWLQTAVALYVANKTQNIPDDDDLRFTQYERFQSKIDFATEEATERWLNR